MGRRGGPDRLLRPRRPRRDFGAVDAAGIRPRAGRNIDAVRAAGIGVRSDRSIGPAIAAGICLETGRDISALVACDSASAGIRTKTARGVGAAGAMRIGGIARRQIMAAIAAGRCLESARDIVAGVAMRIG